MGTISLVGEKEKKPLVAEEQHVLKGGLAKEPKRVRGRTTEGNMVRNPVKPYGP